jgi:hypothetical protein
VHAVGVLDAIDDELQVESTAQAGHDLKEDEAAGSVVGFSEEGPVGLDEVEHGLAETLQGRVPGAVVVEGDADARTA